MKRRISLMLALLMLAMSAASCAEGSSDEAETQKSSTPLANTNDSDDEVPDPFAGVDFEGRDFRINTSTNIAFLTLPSSNYMIQGADELTGDAATDAAINRNLEVAEMLNINLVYEQTNLGYSDVSTYIRNYVTTADDAYDLIINDILGSAPLTVEGAFYNVLDCPNFDFSQPYWYEDFMRDISINYNYQYLLAGDYFLDVLRTSHCMIFNKDLYNDIFGGGADDIYELVLNKEWTYDNFLGIIENCYIDANGDSRKDTGDIYGFTTNEIWGPMIPFLISANPGFVERDESGYPTITVFNERSLKLNDYLKQVFYGTGSGTYDVFGSSTVEEWMSGFSSGNAVFVGSQRLGSLESNTIREVDFEIGVIPYPILDEAVDNYVTSAHDTSEVGLIPITCQPDSLDFISTVVEVLCRETNRDVLPIYYENSLKLKYTRDTLSAQMIDIIHDNVGDSFPLAWSSPIEHILTQGTFFQSVYGGADFAARYQSLEKAAEKKLQTIIEAFEEMKSE